jgi:hypothetical protein
MIRRLFWIKRGKSGEYRDSFYAVARYQRQLMEQQYVARNVDSLRNSREFGSELSIIPGEIVFPLVRIDMSILRYP